MELEHIKDLAHDLMNNFDLKNWWFEFSNTSSAIGDCYGSEKRIRFSKKYKDLTYREIKDTILHEIAHALDYERHGSSSHGQRWKNIAIEVGAKPKASKHISVAPKKKWTSYCEKCGKDTGQMDRRGRYKHKNCGGKILFRKND